MESPKTKKVLVTLGVLTRVEYREVLEVPANMTDRELDALVSQLYDEVDRGKFQADPDYWDRGECWHETEPQDSESTARVARAGRGVVIQREAA